LLWPVAADSHSATAGSFISSCVPFEDCSAAPQNVDLALCLAYVEGAADAFKTLGLVCAPEGITVAQMEAVVVGYLRGHPEERPSPAASEALPALRQAFPCD
jgi:Rap1a immunity proteins